jgi:hypothetical protein
VTSGVGIVGDSNPSAAAGRPDDVNENKFQEAVAGQRNTKTLPELNTDGVRTPPKPRAPGGSRFIPRVGPKPAAAAVVPSPVPAGEPSSESPSALVPDSFLPGIGQKAVEILLKNNSEALAAFKRLLELEPGDVPTDADVLKITSAFPGTYLASLNKQQFVDLHANKPEALAAFKAALGLKAGDAPADATYLKLIACWDVNQEAKKHKLSKKKLAPTQALAPATGQ